MVPTEHQSDSNASDSPPESAVRILVVEDEEALRKAIVFDFKRKGYRTFDAENGAVALEIVKRESIDIVLTDVRMPVADGVQLLEGIKALDPGSPIVMFITGFTDLSLEDAFSKGAEAVFPKPFDRKSLKATVARALLKKEVRWDPASAVDGGLIPEGDPAETLRVDVASKGEGSEGVQVLSIGRGGFFLALEHHRLPRLESVVRFEIHQAGGSEVAGLGQVRWVRTQASPGLPTGCGIEVLSLEEPGRAWYLQETGRYSGRSFIPKS